MLSPLVADAGCRKGMLWRADLTEEVLPEVLVATLLDPTLMDGDVFVATRQCVGAVLFILEHTASGHQVVVVPRTRRLQIRLDGLTPRAERAAAAQNLYAVLTRATALDPNQATGG